jgi:hypothetical protein
MSSTSVTENEVPSSSGSILGIREALGVAAARSIRVRVDDTAFVIDP